MIFKKECGTERRRFLVKCFSFRLLATVDGTCGRNFCLSDSDHFAQIRYWWWLGNEIELVIDKTWKIYRSCKDLKSDIELESFKFDSVWHQAAISDRIAMWGGKSFIISDIWFVLEQTLIHSLFLEQTLIIHSLFWVSKWNIQFANKILLFVSNSKMKCQKFEIYFCCHRL